MTSVIEMRDVFVRRDGREVLADISLTVREGERWVVLGPNGAGKTTLMLIAAARLFPTSGDVELLDEVLGAVEVAELRTRIGWASTLHGMEFPPEESVPDVVMSGAHAVTGRWREEYDEADAARAVGLMAAWGLSDLSDRTFGTLSEGERKRALIARSLMANPELLLLDEPGAGLDLGGREDLVQRLARLAGDPLAPTQVLVTHHVEEIPEGFTHALLLRGGRAVAAGPLGEVLTGPWLNEAFGLRLTVQHDAGRWHARRSRS